MKDLAKEYAALVPDWAQPGMRCVDPVTGMVFMRVSIDLWLSLDLLKFYGEVSRHDALDRAIAAGPDLEDAATVGALLVGLPVKQAVDVLRQSRWARDVSMAGTHDHPASDHADWKLHLINACIAQAKGK